MFIQKDALEQVVLRIGMNNGSFLDHSEAAPVLDRQAALKAKQSASVNLTIRLVSWTFGWMPRAAINSFQRFMMDNFLPEESDAEDDE